MAISSSMSYECYFGELSLLAYRNPGIRGNQSGVYEFNERGRLGSDCGNLRLDVISENITNINTTRTEGGGPYRRKVVVLEGWGSARRFSWRWPAPEARRLPPRPEGACGVEIAEDPSDF